MTIIEREIDERGWVDVLGEMLSLAFNSAIASKGTQEGANLKLMAEWLAGARLSAHDAAAARPRVE